jgi:hypothetical protein
MGLPSALPRWLCMRLLRLPKGGVCLRHPSRSVPYCLASPVALFDAFLETLVRKHTVESDCPSHFFTFSASTPLLLFLSPPVLSSTSLLPSFTSSPTSLLFLFLDRHVQQLSCVIPHRLCSSLPSSRVGLIALFVVM